MTTPAGFVGSFYDLATSMRFCADSAASSNDPATKTGREVRCLEELLQRPEWRPATAERPLTVVDLGSGSGEKARRVLAALRDDGSSPLAYIPVDASPYCASFAITTVLQAFGGLDAAAQNTLVGRTTAYTAGPAPMAPAEVARCMTEHAAAISTVTRDGLTVATRGIGGDFVTDTAWVLDVAREHPARVDGGSIYLLLGQTFGNHRPADRDELLRRLRSAMAADDLLVVDAGIRPQDGDSVASVEAAYRREARRFMLHKADDLASTFHVAYDPERHRIEHWFIRPDGSKQPLGFSTLFLGDGLDERLRRAGLAPLAAVRLSSLGGLGPGPDCTVVMARAA